MGSLFGGGNAPSQPIDPPARSVTGADQTEEGFDPLAKKEDVEIKETLAKPTGASPSRVDKTAVV